MEAMSGSTRSLFLRYVANEAPQGAIGAVSDLLVANALSRDTFDALVAEYAVAASSAFRDGLLDLVLFCVRDAVRDHCLTTDELDAIRGLYVTFRLREGDFYLRRRKEVAEILQVEMHRILDDERVDAAEVSYLEALQRVFGLGYDQYLELTRDAVTPLIDRAITRAAGDGIVTGDERAELDRRIAALSTVYPLSAEQRRALGQG